MELAPHYSRIGRPSIDPVLMIRMLIVAMCLHYVRNAGWGSLVLKVRPVSEALICRSFVQPSA
jgi:hypothetical protein